KYTIPAGRTIPANGYMLLWADEEGNQNRDDRELHLNFRLSADGETIGFFDPNGRRIDTVTFLAQTADVSEGRFPDGATGIFSMTIPTPRVANVVQATEVRVLSITYDVAIGVTLTWTAQSGSIYRVEYKNDLSDSTWTPLPGDVIAVSDTASTVDTTIAPVAQRFYRIVR
ncbi:MAG TPA: hypothetical protein VFC26_04345, partial [Verrucomicrobiae bacterium]|nr:hypothetical protein [Verrucomicrobiae bacterium]